MKSTYTPYHILKSYEKKIKIAFDSKVLRIIAVAKKNY